MTPTEYRKRFDEWRKTAPANDSDIIPPPPRYSGSSRHHELARALGVLLLWRCISEPVQPLSTNWLVPDNDNEYEDGDGPVRALSTSVECEYVIRPSDGEINRALDGVTFEIRPDGRKVPVAGPNVEFGPEKPFSWHSKITGLRLEGKTRPVTRLGALRFSAADSVGEGKNKTPGRGELLTWQAGPESYGRRISDAFGAPLGGVARGTDSSGFAEADEWLIRNERLTTLRSQLSRDDAAALDTALHASTFRDVGQAFGFKGKTAERQGQQRLLTACKNLSNLIDREAA
jgi:hypothetical protein